MKNKLAIIRLTILSIILNYACSFQKERRLKNALLWLAIPERIVNQRIFFIENNSIKTY